MSKFYCINNAACIGCETCAGECFNRAIGKAPDGWGMVIDQTKCEGCGNCADICPADAIKLVEMETKNA